jgi:hypothetical protein
VEPARQGWMWNRREMLREPRARPVVCQNSADRDAKWDRRFALKSRLLPWDESSSLALARRRLSRLNRLRFEISFAGEDFPVRQNRFPAPDHGDAVASTLEMLRNIGSCRTRIIRIRRSSLYFPCTSGARPRRRVLPRLRLPPLSLREQRLIPQIHVVMERFTRIHGFLAVGVRCIRSRDGRSWRGSRRLRLCFLALKEEIDRLPSPPTSAPRSSRGPKKSRSARSPFEPVLSRSKAPDFRFPSSRSRQLSRLE